MTDAHESMDPTPNLGVMKEVLDRIESRAAKKEMGFDVGPFVVDETLVKQLIVTSMTLGKALAFVKMGMPYGLALTAAVMTMHGEEVMGEEGNRD